MKPVPVASASRQGIALIAVLSFLGILLVLAVALVTMMRTERLVSEAAKDDAAARIFLKGCVNAAMDDISDVLWNAGTKNIRVDRSLAVIEAQGGDGALGANSGIVDGEVVNWLHRKYLSGDPDFDAEAIAENAQWINVRDPVPASRPLLGRFVYLAMENSGAYDANLVAMGGPRRFGLSIGEVSNLPEIVNALYLRENRANIYHRFSTMGEIAKLNDGLQSLGGKTNKLAIAAAYLDNLVPYSLCYDAGWWDWTSSTWHDPGATYTNDGTAVLVPGNINTWTTNKAAAAFVGLLGVNSTLAGAIATNYLDFVDPDHMPRTVESFTTEAVPMINEISAFSWMSNDLSGQVTHTISIKIETWFPFRGNERSGDRYTFPNPVITAYDSGAGVAFGRNPAFANAFPAGGALPSSGPTPTNIPATEGYVVTEFRYEAIFSDAVITTNTPIGYGVLVYSLDLNDSGGRPIDRAHVAEIGGGCILTPLNITVPARGGHADSSKVAASVNDPRMNFSSASWSLQAETPSGQNNNMTTIGPNGREGTDMFVRNGTIETPAELGYLSLGSNWYTFTLFSQPGRELLTKFRATGFPGKTYTNGFVNPNSLSKDVLTAAFQGAPIEHYPGEPLTNTYGTLSTTQADLIAQTMLFTSTNVALSGSDTFDSAAAWVIAPAFTYANGVLSTLDNNQKESVIRNSYRLFNANQNLFTLIVLAQTTKDADRNGKYDPPPGGADEISGEKRAVALVWRDPFPNSDGRHETFIRLFRYLDE
ncbi:MAG: hypothetical protein V1929_07225 [bacterium]